PPAPPPPDCDKLPPAAPPVPPVYAPLPPPPPFPPVAYEPPLPGDPPVWLVFPAVPAAPAPNSVPTLEPLLPPAACNTEVLLNQVGAPAVPTCILTLVPGVRATLVICVALPPRPPAPAQP